MTRLSVTPEHVLRHGALEAVLSPSAGGRIVALRSIDARDGTAVDWLRPIDDEARRAGFDADAWPKGGCYPLVPFSNRIRDGHFEWAGRAHRLPLHPGEAHALHGVGHRMPWTLAEHDARSARMVCRHAANATGKGGWPWPFDATQHVQLDDDGLHVTLELTNQADEAMPCGMGLHPFFPARFGHRVRFDAGSVWQADAAHLATGARHAVGPDSFAQARSIATFPFSRYYGECTGGVELAARNGDMIRITPDASLRHLVLHAAGDPSAGPSGAYLCIEPVSHVADAVNLAAAGVDGTGWRTIAPGASWRCGVAMRLSRGLDAA